MELKRTMGHRIKLARQHIGMSQEELANRMGVRRQSVQQWESEETGPRHKRLAELAKVLRVDQMWLVMGETDDHMEDEVLGVLGFEERKLVKLFRQLPIEQQLLLSDIANSMSVLRETMLRRAAVTDGTYSEGQKPQLVPKKEGNNDN